MRSALLRGGVTLTKIHALTDQREASVRIRLTAGQAGDNPQPLPLLDDHRHASTEYALGSTEFPLTRRQRPITLAPQAYCLRRSAHHPRTPRSWIDPAQGLRGLLAGQLAFRRCALRVATPSNALPSTQKQWRGIATRRLQIRPDLTSSARPAGLRCHPRPSGNPKIGRHAPVGMIPAASTSGLSRRRACAGQGRAAASIDARGCAQLRPGRSRATWAQRREAIQQALVEVCKVPADQGSLPTFPALSTYRVRRIDRPRSSRPQPGGPTLAAGDKVWRCRAHRSPRSQPRVHADSDCTSARICIDG